MNEEMKKSKEDYLKMKKLKRDTHRSYSLAINNFLAFCENESISLEDVQTIDQEFIQNFSQYLKNNGYKEQSIHLFIRILKNFLSYTNEAGTTDVVLSFSGQDELNPPKIVNLDDFLKILTYLDLKNKYSYKLLFLLVYYTGLKSKHLIGVKYSDFGRDEEGFFYYNTLYKKQPFKMYLHEDVEKYVRIVNKMNEEKYGREHDLLFVSNKGNQYTPHTVAYIFRTICKNVGVDSYTPKDFRHTAVVNYYNRTRCSASELALRFNWARDNSERIYHFEKEE